MRLTVTQEHIDQALARRDTGFSADYNCPVALALQAAGYPRAKVGSWGLWPKPRSRKVQHSKALHDYIQVYDVTRQAVPRTFVVKGLQDA